MILFTRTIKVMTDDDDDHDDDEVPDPELVVVAELLEVAVRSTLIKLSTD